MLYVWIFTWLLHSTICILYVIRVSMHNHVIIHRKITSSTTSWQRTVCAYETSLHNNSLVKTCSQHCVSVLMKFIGISIQVCILSPVSAIIFVSLILYHIFEYISFHHYTTVAILVSCQLLFFQCWLICLISFDIVLQNFFLNFMLPIKRNRICA